MMEKILTTKPSDFDEVWSAWLNEVKDVKNEIEIVSINEASFGKIIKFYFMSIAKTKIYAILYYVNNTNDNLVRPLIAYYHGHNSYIEEDFNIASCMDLVNAGCSVVAMDMRFQNGLVRDLNEYRYKEYPSFCYNIDNINESYQKRILLDAIKLIDLISDENIFKELSHAPLVTSGPSQGGGLSLLVSAFCHVDLVLADIPSDCALKNRILGRFGKYTVLDDFIRDHEELKDIILHNQDYFDIINMADKIKAEVVASIGLADDVCPGDFFKVAYNLMNTKKYLYEYPGFGHGGFDKLHLPVKIKHLYELYPYIKK